jgi:hypothetical protein
LTLIAAYAIFAFAAISFAMMSAMPLMLSFAAFIIFSHFQLSPFTPYYLSARHAEFSLAFAGCATPSAAADIFFAAELLFADAIEAAS